MIPDKVKIGGITYSVEVTEDEIYDRGRLLEGLISYSKGTIKLDKEMQDEYLERTFLHEVLHGIFESLGMYEDGEPKIDEITANAISNALYQVLKDNDISFRQEYAGGEIIPVKEVL